MKFSSHGKPYIRDDFLSYILDFMQVIRFHNLCHIAVSTSKPKPNQTNKKLLLEEEDKKAICFQRGLFVNCFGPLYKVKSILLMTNLICSGREKKCFLSLLRVARAHSSQWVLKRNLATSERGVLKGQLMARKIYGIHFPETDIQMVTSDRKQLYISAWCVFAPDD